MITPAEVLRRDSDLGADVCVIGAGPAGIATAKRLADRGASVLLVESGAAGQDHHAQRLSRGTVVGHPTWPLDRSRFRGVGGTGQQWGGWCRELDAEDVRELDWLPGSGWPVSTDTLALYYRQARAELGLPPEAARVSSDVQDAPLPTTAGMDVDCYEFSRHQLSMGEHARRRLDRDPSIRVLVGATVTDLRLAPGSECLEHVRVRTAAGGGLTLRAREFVLATGGIENARLLLAATHDRPTGLGNEHDVVGRYFMDHLHAEVGHVLLDAAQAASPLFRALDYRGRTDRVGPALVGGTRVRRENRLLAASFTATRAPHHFGQPLLGLPVRWRIPLDDVARASALNESGEDVPAHLIPVSSAAARLFLVGHRRYRELRFRSRRRALLRLAEQHELAVADIRSLYVRSEQAPNPESRVVLGSRRDAHGVRRAALDWKVTDTDTDTVDAWLERLVEAARALPGIIVAPDPEWRSKIVGGPHHMGTTRMSLSPTTGVVDEYCRVHSVANLHVAGSSVFPTGGYANPTLTVVALALRLADHLAERIGSVIAVRQARPPESVGTDLG